VPYRRAAFGDELAPGCQPPLIEFAAPCGRPTHESSRKIRPLGRTQHFANIRLAHDSEQMSPETHCAAPDRFLALVDTTKLVVTTWIQAIALGKRAPVQDQYARRTPLFLLAHETGEVGGDLCGTAEENRTLCQLGRNEFARSHDIRKGTRTMI